MRRRCCWPPAAVHLLPTPEMIARTAWLMALTGKEAQARVWLMRLRFYYAGDEAAQYATVNKACTGVRAEDRPEACDWVRKQAASHRKTERAADCAGSAAPCRCGSRRSAGRYAGCAEAQ